MVHHPIRAVPHLSRCNAPNESGGKEGGVMKKKQSRSKAVSVWLPSEVADWIKDQAKAEGLSIDEFIEKALGRLLTKHNAAA